MGDVRPILSRGVLAGAVFMAAIVGLDAMPLSSFRSMTTVPVPKDATVVVASDAMFARQKISFSRDLKDNERRVIAASLEGKLTRNVQWDDDDMLTVEWTTPFGRVARVAGDGYVVGEIRELGFLPSYFLGAGCIDLFSIMRESSTYTDLIALCEEGTGRVRMPDRPTEDEEYLVELIGVQSRANWAPDPGRLEGWVEAPYVSEDARRIARFQLAMAYVRAGDDASALRILDEISKVRLFGVPKRVQRLEHRMAQGLFERSVESALSRDEGARAINLYDGYPGLETGTFETHFKFALIEAYDVAKRPEGKVRQYLDLFKRGGFDEDDLLPGLAQSYREAGQNFRAFATSAYAVERHPKKHDSLFDDILRTPMKSKVVEPRARP